MITLIKPCKEFERDIFKYKDEMIAAGNGSMDGCGGLDRFFDFDEWLKFLESLTDRNRINPSSGFVEGSQYLLVDDERKKVLGMVNLRHSLNDFLFRVGGHIGYSVRPDERGRGYAKLQLKLALEKIAEQGVREVLITCTCDNAASARTIEACGGALENVIHSPEYGCDIKRYWIHI
ncbi:MAG: GNAT family N-acetyltransferase [Clostridia bacterium]|nr:GNAT family N-acetyltransferase [Clostridia bacterium]